LHTSNVFEGTMRIINAAVVVALYLLTPVYAQEDTNGDGYVDALIPIVVTEDVSPGAYGSRWSTEVWINNRSGITLDRIQRALSDPDCVLPDQPCAPNAVAGETRRPILYARPFNPDWGALLFFANDVAPRVSLSARVLELSRGSQPHGVEIPVIWEDEYLTGTSMLLAIPQSEDSRVALRVYDPRLQSNSAIRVEFLTTEGTTITTTTLAPRSSVGLPIPGFAGINDLAAAFPLLQGYDRFDVRLTPLTSGTEYWAFATVTHRETQHVLLVTPDKRR
jgi:hypothetical protein